MAARLFFVLEYFGHERVRVMNGGLAKWRREGRPLEIAAPAIAPRRFEPRPRRELVATAAEVRASLGRADACLIDARSPAEFTGTDSGGGARRPHPRRGERGLDLHPEPGRHVQGRRRAPGALRGGRALAGPDGGRLLHQRDALLADYLALRLLGHARIRNYDGSWMEWANTPTLPVER